MKPAVDPARCRPGSDRLAAAACVCGHLRRGRDRLQQCEHSVQQTVDPLLAKSIGLGREQHHPSVPHRTELISEEFGIDVGTNDASLLLMPDQVRQSFPVGSVAPRKDGRACWFDPGTGEKLELGKPKIAVRPHSVKQQHESLPHIESLPGRTKQCIELVKEMLRKRHQQLFLAGKVIGYCTCCAAGALCDRAQRCAGISNFREDSESCRQDDASPGFLIARRSAPPPRTGRCWRACRSAGAFLVNAIHGQSLPHFLPPAIFITTVALNSESSHELLAGTHLPAPSPWERARSKVGEIARNNDRASAIDAIDQHQYRSRNIVVFSRGKNTYGSGS